MKRLITALVKIEMDDSHSDYCAANMKTPWDIVVSDHLNANNRRVRDYCSIQTDEIKDPGEKK